MNNSQREEEVYAAAVELPPAERPAFLARACAGDDALRARVEALLAANDDADDFFRSTALPRPITDVQEKPGDRIGRYKLLQKIGEGGCGVVYMAEQEEPVRRRVALKVIKLGMDTKAVIARFEAERQALALMEHPNIARVLDAGATDTGRPFFVMELVRGIPITRFCDEENLSTDERLRLFIQVCHAIQHAHQKGIIHRDIKPTNILVTMHDDTAVPKVIDFGIAKATQGRLTDQTVFTAFEQFMGTPAYMSPEQAQFNDLDVDARSDIYSLGVLLYELLTGRPPFDPKTLQQQGIDEIRRIIREVEPPRPSLRLSTLAEADRATIAKARRTAPQELSSSLRGDLDWIAMKALEKNRTRRYDSANNLAADLKRHLQNEPVVARPPSVVYRTQKFATRHRVALGAAAAIVVALGIGIGVSRFVVTPRAILSPALTSRAGADVATLRKLPLANVDWVLTVSPDGQLIAYTPSNDADVYIYDVATGKSSRFLSCTDSNGPWAAHISPDNRQVAYDTAGTSLCIANIDGSSVRQLLPPQKDTYYASVGWVNGRLLGVIQKSEFLSTYAWFDGRTGAMQPLPLAPMKNNQWRLSARGDYMATRKDFHDLSVIELATGREEIIAQSITSVVGWAHSDTELLFTTDRTGANVLWTVAIKDGKAAGEPRQVKELGEAIRLTAVTSDGRIYYSERKNSSNVSVASVNFETGAVASAPRRVTDRFPGLQTEPTWSRDGAKLWLTIEGDQRRLLSTLSAGRQEEFPLVLAFGPRLRPGAWSRDGSFVLVQGRKVKGKEGIHRFEPATGKIETLVPKESGEWLSNPRLAPDEQSFFFVRRKFFSTANGDDWTDKIIQRDFQTKRETIVFEGAQVNLHRAFELSPDGTQLAVVTSSQFRDDNFVVALKLIDLGTGRQRELLRLAPRENINGLGWTKDGQRLAYIREIPSPEKGRPNQSSLWSLAVASGQSIAVKFTEPAMSKMVIHPDGQRIAYCTGWVGESMDVWVMEGVMPKPNSEQTIKLQAISSSQVSVAELVKADGSVFDREKGVRAVLPAGWTIKRATRSLTEAQPNIWPEGLTGLELDWPGKKEKENARLGYHIYEAPRPMPRAELEAWLRDFSSHVVESRSVGMPDYKIIPESFVIRTIGGHAALSWVADFTLWRSTERGREYATVIRSERGHAFVWLAARTEDAEGLRPEIERLTESVRLP